ncbi:hypothetical protein ABIF23_007495 [Bradyrhizobium elkanii]
MSDFTWPAPVPKVMLVAVPLPVAPMVSVRPLSGLPPAEPLAVADAPAGKPSCDASPELKVSTVTASEAPAVLVLVRTRSPLPLSVALTLALVPTWVLIALVIWAAV